MLVTAALCVHVLLQFRKEGNQRGQNTHQDDHKQLAPSTVLNIHHKFATITKQLIYSSYSAQFALT